MLMLQIGVGYVVGVDFGSLVFAIVKAGVCHLCSWWFVAGMFDIACVLLLVTVVVFAIVDVGQVLLAV